ncbi:hypothetical protein ACFSQP_11120 [Bizionia sediminis]|uniref:Tetratricopeptide repeat protein n=1 Tax=Bizionia sediminis TaxID=1737064 RepID=A0ABW5KV89_9FLAO
MTASEFYSIIQNPQQVTPEQTNQLAAIVAKYPYFQAARASYLKGLKNKSSVKYNNALKVTAAYTTDRSVLFDFITSEVFLQNDISQHIKKHQNHLNQVQVTTEIVAANNKQRIDSLLNKQITETEGTLDPELFQPISGAQPNRPSKQAAPITETANKPTDAHSIDTANSVSRTPENRSENTDKPEDILKLGQPLQFNPNEKHSFNEWLSLTRFEPINRADSQNPPQKTASKTASNTSGNASLKQNKRLKKFDLIDQFISKNPKLKPTKTSATTTNIAEAQMIQPEALMTETLARIYVEQKNYKKAIQSYNILSLKYPEKSGFFADQIKAVKKLQEQNNQ